MIFAPKDFIRFATLAAGLALGQSAASSVFAAEVAPVTEQQYLSGHGPKDAVPWEFSVTGGRRAGEKTTLPVPSHWELYGFGTYNYGEERTGRADEHGLYRHAFKVPETWKDRRVHLVFEGVMTDTTVKVNGHLAGPLHQGGFYRFSHDITGLVKFGEENMLEVDVAKVSANALTEVAERYGDYWVFGGIFRPVYLEAVPVQSIERSAIDAKADGSLKVDVTLASVRDADRVEAQVIGADGKEVGAPFISKIPGGGTGRVALATRVDGPRLWTAETPNLYTLKLTLKRGSEILHTITERFGFRTFEVRAGQGFFLNGQRILLKGVGRHSFRPETGRALTREDCYEDVRLLQSMNLNAVRMTHYPPDVAFLEACDELGLYVIDELSGWQHGHDTEVGRRLVRELITRDVNHPSIILWDNGNEGGWNRALDGEFAFYDPQNRAVMHPWEAFNGVDTKHYPIYDDLKKRLSGPNLVMPTEMLHGLYDGGAGAGVEDYWNAISHSPFGAGGFIWVFADEGLVRTDQGGRVDVFSTYAPDGIVGPHHEKEGSYYTVRDVYSPVQIDRPVLDEHFKGQVTVHNHYAFTALNRIHFSWRLLRFPGSADGKMESTVLAQGAAAAPAIAPGGSGLLALDLPPKWREAEAVELVATDWDKRDLWTWTWPTPALGQPLATVVKQTGTAPTVETTAGEVRLHGGAVTAHFDAATGILLSIQQGQKTYALTNGPRLAFARVPVSSGMQWLDVKAMASGSPDGLLLARLEKPQLANMIEVELDDRELSWAGFRLEISPEGQNWKTIYDGTRRSRDGKAYEFPPQIVGAIRISQLRQSYGGAVKVKSVRAGYEPARFAAADSGARKVATGNQRDAKTGESVAWLESTAEAGLKRFRWTLNGAGELRLDYVYSLDGEFSYHGVTFDLPENKLKTLRWLGEGPFRVWQNRLRGTTLGVYEVAQHDLQPGESWVYPEFQGCFAGVRWARLETNEGPLAISPLVTDDKAPATYLRVGTPRISHPNTTVAFPAGDLSFLHVIPAIGSKFFGPEKTGPSSLPIHAAGEFTGTVAFQFGETP